jgi:hypothetical protein
MKRLLYIFLIQAAFANAQVVGYMGKRLIIGYSNNFSIAGVGPTAESYDPGFNTTHCFNLEYIIKNRTNFCLSYQMLKTGVEIPYDFYVQTYNSAYGYSEGVSYTYAGSAPMQVSTKNFGIGFKFFPQGTLSPIGKYRKLELLLLFSDFTYPRNSFDYYNSTDYTMKKGSVGTGDYSFKTFAITYTMGHQRVLFNRIVFDYGIQFGFLPAGAFGYLTDGEFTTGGSYESVFRQETNQRLFRHQMFSFHLGLGLLAI